MQTTVPSTGHLRSNTCVDANGVMTFQGVSGIASGTVTPSCTLGQIFLFQNTATNQLLFCNNGTITTASGSPATAIDITQYVGQPDGQWFYATAVSVTGGSPNVTITGANFCNAG